MPQCTTVTACSPAPIVVRLSSSLAATGRATLARRGKAVYSHAVKAAPGATTIKLFLPARVAKGTYALTLSLSSAGGAATIRRLLRVPR